MHRSASDATVREWFIGRPFDLVLAAAASAASPLHLARETLISWRELPLNEWLSAAVWSDPLHEALCQAMPKILHDAHILLQPYMCLNWHPLPGWADLHGQVLSLPTSEAHVAAMTVYTPTPHFVLVQKLPKVRIDTRTHTHTHSHTYTQTHTISTRHSILTLATHSPA